LRKPIANCVDRDGTFLDLCCANGFLLECASRWTQERGITVRPYGLDISPKLIDLAKARLPEYKSCLFAGNSFVWLPPEKMDFVNTMSGLYPRQYEDDYIHFVVQNHLKDEGKLLVHCTGPEGGAEQSMRESFSLDQFNQVGHEMGFDPVMNKEVYVAIIMKGPPNQNLERTRNTAPLK
jgi:SAM-dependent methyltransferase